MANTSIGTAWIQIKPTTTGISSAIKKELNTAETAVGGSESNLTSAFSAMGSKAGLAMKAGLITAAAAAVAGAVKLVKQAVANFAEYEQLVGGVDTLFKDSSQELQGYADQAFKTTTVICAMFAPHDNSAKQPVSRL